MSADNVQRDPVMDRQMQTPMTGARMEVVEQRPGFTLARVTQPYRHVDGELVLNVVWSEDDQCWVARYADDAVTSCIGTGDSVQDALAHLCGALLCEVDAWQTLYHESSEQRAKAALREIVAAFREIDASACLNGLIDEDPVEWAPDAIIQAFRDSIEGHERKNVTVSAFQSLAKAVEASPSQPIGADICIYGGPQSVSIEHGAWSSDGKAEHTSNGATLLDAVRSMAEKVTP